MDLREKVINIPYRYIWEIRSLHVVNTNKKNQKEKQGVIICNANHSICQFG